MIHNDTGHIKYIFPRVAIFSFLLSAFCGCLNLGFLYSESFASLFNSTVASVLRFSLAKISDLIPFSIAECFLLLSPFILLALIVLVVKSKGNRLKTFARMIVIVVSIFGFVYSSFVLTFASGYYSSDFEKKIGITRHSLAPEELYDASIYLIDMINGISDEITFENKSCSIMPYSNSEMIDIINEAYSNYAETHNIFGDFHSEVKQIALSGPMTYTHISGVYTFFTGESNINVNYPDFILPYTTAHELAHQRGIAREDEANFLAFLVCEGASDPYVRYSSYLNMFEYVSEALYKADKDLYLDVYSNLSSKVKFELYAYSKFFDKYRDSNVSKISNTVNNSFLTAQGTPGVKSYGMVVDLFVSLIQTREKMSE